MPSTISRRCVVGMMGAVGAAGVLSEAPAFARGAALVDPIAVGSQFGRWKVVAIHEVEDGALRVDVSGEDGHVFVIENPRARPVAAGAAASGGDRRARALRAQRRRRLVADGGGAGARGDGARAGPRVAGQGSRCLGAPDARRARRLARGEVAGRGSARCPVAGARHRSQRLTGRRAKGPGSGAPHGPHEGSITRRSPAMTGGHADRGRSGGGGCATSGVHRAVWCDRRAIRRFLHAGTERG